jgi:hypothetical protein
MRKIRWIPLLIALFLLIGCGGKEQKTIGADDVVLTVGSEPVYAAVYRYHLKERYDAIRTHELYDYDRYLSYVSNPNVSYLYAYYDTRTEEGKKALSEDVLTELALEAAAIDAGTKAGYELNIAEQSYLRQAEDDAAGKLSDQLTENGGAYASREAFFEATGFTEARYTEMFVRSMKAGILYNRLLEDYKASHTLSDEELTAGYARIVKETFIDRYTDGMYSQYLYYYLQGRRTFPSLYVPEDAIFIRLFAAADPTDEQIEAFKAQAETDFTALYESRDNEFLKNGSAGDLAVAPKDEMFIGLFDAAKDVPIGSVGTLMSEKDGKTLFCLFLRTEGETGVVPIDRYPGVRERITNQLLGTKCMDTLREAVKDPAVTTRNEDVIKAVVAAIG